MDSCEARDNTSALKDQILGQTQYFARLTQRTRRTIFVNPTAIRLGINARAANENHESRRKGNAEVPRSLQIHSSIVIDITAPSACALNHDIKRPISLERSGI